MGVRNLLSRDFCLRLQSGGPVLPAEAPYPRRLRAGSFTDVETETGENSDSGAEPIPEQAPRLPE